MQAVAALIPQPIETVSAALANGDAAVAVQVLRGLDWCQPRADEVDIVEEAERDMSLDDEIERLMCELQDKRVVESGPNCGESAKTI